MDKHNTHITTNTTTGAESSRTVPGANSGANANRDSTIALVNDKIVETGVKYEYPWQFETTDDQHTRVPGTDASTKGAPAHTSSGGFGKQGSPIAMNRTDGNASHGDQAYQSEFGTQEMYRKQPDTQTLSVSDASINTGSLSGGNRAANITTRKAVGTASTGTYDKGYRN